jgi:hypothetical protein
LIELIFLVFVLTVGSTLDIHERTVLFFGFMHHEV